MALDRFFLVEWLVGLGFAGSSSFRRQETLEQCQTEAAAAGAEVSGCRSSRTSSTVTATRLATPTATPLAIRITAGSVAKRPHSERPQNGASA